MVSLAPLDIPHCFYSVIIVSFGFPSFLWHLYGTPWLPMAPRAAPVVSWASGHYTSHHRATMAATQMTHIQKKKTFVLVFCCLHTFTSLREMEEGKSKRKFPHRAVGQVSYILCPPSASSCQEHAPDGVN